MKATTFKKTFFTALFLAALSFSSCGGNRAEGETEPAMVDTTSTTDTTDTKMDVTPDNNVKDNTAVDKDTVMGP